MIERAEGAGPEGREGRREWKKRETLKRIVEAGLRLFVKNGYEGTTLDEIAAEAGIARRTFFYYFKSKEAILMAYLDGGFARSSVRLLRAQPTDQAPLTAVLNSFSQSMSWFESEEAIVVDTLLGSTEALRARMQANYVETEHLIFEALCELWPQPERTASLRIAAMASVGAMRVAKEAWRQEEGKRPLAEHLRESFAALERIV
jgi:AcrR family transcriptional regulator